MPARVSFSESSKLATRSPRKDASVPVIVGRCGLACNRETRILTNSVLFPPVWELGLFSRFSRPLCTPRNAQGISSRTSVLPASLALSKSNCPWSLIVAVIIAALSASKITRGCAGWTTDRLCLLGPIATAFRGPAGYHVTCAPLTSLLVDPPKDSFGPFAGGRSPRRARKPAQTRWQSRRRSHWIVPGSGLDENEKERERDADEESKEARLRRRLSPSCEHVRRSMLPDVRSHPDDRHCEIFHISRRVSLAIRYWRISASARICDISW